MDVESIIAFSQESGARDPAWGTGAAMIANDTSKVRPYYIINFIKVSEIMEY